MATLQNMRDNAQGTIARIIIGLIAISFAIFGFGTLTGYQSGGNTVVSVNDIDISEQEVARGINLRRRELAARLGQNLDEALISDTALRPTVVEQLIRQKLLLESIDNANLYYADAMVDNVIVSQPQFQQDGRFAPELFRGLVLQSGFSPLEYRRLLREELLIGQLSSGFSQTAFITSQELDRATALAEQQRDIAFLRLPVSDYRTNIDISEQDIQDYYEENLEQFRTEDQIVVDYIELKKDDLLDQIEISEEEIEQEYETQLNEFAPEQERRAAHILLELGDDRDEDQALSLLSSIKQRVDNGEDFGELAKELSDDQGSAESNGDLGFAGKDTFVPEFEEALFALEEGQISEPVQTQFGYHIIKLLEIRDSEAPGYGELAVTIENELREQKAVELFVEKKGILEELVFESGDLTDPADATELTVKESEPFSINRGTGIANNARVRSAAFSEDVRDGVNSEIIEIDDNNAVVLREKSFTESRIRELSEVTDQISTTLATDIAKENAKKAADEIIEQLKQASSASEVASSLDLEWSIFSSVKRSEAAVPRDVLNAAFKLEKPDDGKRTVSTLQTTSGDVYIITIANVVDTVSTDLEKTEKEQLKAVFENSQGRHSYDEFRLALLKGADIKRTVASE